MGRICKKKCEIQRLAASLDLISLDWGQTKRSRSVFTEIYINTNKITPTTKTRHLIRRRDILETLTNTKNTFCREALIKDTTNYVSPID